MKTMKKVVSVILLGAMALSMAGCSKKIQTVDKKDFKDAVKEALDADKSDIRDWDNSDNENLWYYEGKFYVDMYIYDDEDDAADRFEDLYDDYQDMIKDKEFDGKSKAVMGKTYGYILLNGEVTDDDYGFAETDVYGGYFWVEDQFFIIICRSTKDKNTQQIDALLDALGFPQP